ncbi:hypothetical protein V6N13_079650 [Hibiscus sabdariffa]|uniref:Uncharacterized protein n=1 Tax=Hibiscus sabdariffa TaxID=183260 RepID=A0ABR2RS70_9ROSI
MKKGDSKFGQHLECNNDTFQPHVVTLRNSRENLPTPVTVHSKLKFPSTQLGLVPVPGVRMHEMFVACKNIIPQVDYGQTGLSPECSPFPLTTSVHSNLEFNDSEQGYH